MAEVEQRKREQRADYVMTKTWEWLQMAMHTELVPWVQGMARDRWEGKREGWKEIQEVIEGFSEEAKSKFP